MKWTEKQYKAIYERDRNLLVAAAAGSGKTAVLVERIKQLILRDGCSLDRMLVVTFTNAAAAEMKAKIEKAIRDEIESLGSDESREARDKTELLKRQLDLLPMAQISTFHSFAMEVVKKFFFTIGCEPNFRICDEANRAILEGAAMDSLFEGRYEEDSDEFYRFLRKYGESRSDESVKKMIYALSARLEAMPYPDEWLREKTEALLLDAENISESPLYEEIRKDAEKVFSSCGRILSESMERFERMGLRNGMTLPQSDMAKFEELKDKFLKGNYEEIKEALGSFSLERMNQKYYDPEGNPGCSPVELAYAKDLTDSTRKQLREAMSGLKKALFSMSLEDMSKEISSTYEDVRYLGNLTKEFQHLYQEEKKKRGLMDFSDLEHYAFEILKNEEVAGYYRDRFEHIFVDEYQDSNILQEALIGRIAGKRNLFTVGDVKQSIYKFRLAEPEIFQNRYKRYRDELNELRADSTSEKIDLNQNFRSKESVISFINEVFSDAMEEYGEEEALHAGDLNKDEDNYAPYLYLADESWSDDEEIDDAIKDLKKSEKEALLIAKLIKKYLGRPIFDSKMGCERPLTKKDIVILMRGIKNRGDVIYKVLMENDIPCYVDDNKGYFDTIEINTFMSLMEVIDNQKQDVQLLTVLRSEILNFEISELAAVRAFHKEGTFYDSLLLYSKEGEDEALRKKCCDALLSISSWQDLSRVTPLDELVWTLMIDTGFYASMGAMPGGALRQANLRLLADKALDYRRNQKGGLYGFIRYVDRIKERDVSMGQARVISEDEDTVRIMTIHHSKGLEFPMVIIAGYTRKLGGDNSSGKLLLHKDLGIGLSVVDPERFYYKDTILQTLIKRRNKLEDDEEEKRVLYVAMTRAKDILLMTGTVKEPEEAVQKVRDDFPSNFSYFTMTGRTIAASHLRIRTVDDKELARVAGLRRRSLKKALAILDGDTHTPDPETERIMGYRYGYPEDLRIKSKYSVSELNRADHYKTMTFDPSVPRIPEENTLSASHTGTVTHAVLEKMDFGRISELDSSEGEAAVRELIKGMIREEFLTEEEGDSVKAEKLYEFAVSPLGKRIGEAQKKGLLFRERPFNILMPVEGTEAMVQGIIDCWFKEDDGLVLVDYKTTAPRNVPGVKDRYRIQMDIYRDALEKATGLKVKESYLYLTNLALTVDMY